METYSGNILKILESTVQKKEIPIELILPHNRQAKLDKRRIREEEGIEDGLTDENLKDISAQGLRSVGVTRRLFERTFINVTDELPSE